MTISEEFPSYQPFNLLDIDISQDADWWDGFQIVEAEGDPLDLTGKTLELYIRPKWAHATLLKKLTTAGGAGILVDDASQGMASFFLDRGAILTDLPIGEWQQFLVLTEGAIQTEIWRGQMVVHPGIIAA
jgi:hypothetical protein